MDTFLWLLAPVACTAVVLLGAAVALAAMSRHTDPADAEPRYTLTRYRPEEKP